MLSRKQIFKNAHEKARRIAHTNPGANYREIFSRCLKMAYKRRKQIQKEVHPPVMVQCYKCHTIHHDVTTEHQQVKCDKCSTWINTASAQIIDYLDTPGRLFVLHETKVTLKRKIKFAVSTYQKWGSTNEEKTLYGVEMYNTKAQAWNRLKERHAEYGLLTGAHCELLIGEYEVDAQICNESLRAVQFQIGDGFVWFCKRDLHIGHCNRHVVAAHVEIDKATLELAQRYSK